MNEKHVITHVMSDDKECLTSFHGYNTHTHTYRMKDYTLNEGDPLIDGIPKRDNPFAKRSRGCAILWAGTVVYVLHNNDKGRLLFWYYRCPYT